MQTPPFAPSTLAGVVSSALPRLADGAAPTAVDRRARLADLNPHYHCSLIGTCIGTGALRKLMRRLAPGGASDGTDLDLHHDAVSLANEGGAAACGIGKALDDQHAATIRRFAAAVDEAALARLWSDAMRSGEVPGAYWAVMTHPRTTPALQGRAFGDVHMLSHLVGSANRADIRRLVVLEKDNGALQAQCDALQSRVQEITAERDDQVARLRAELARARGQVDRLAAQPTPAHDTDAALADAAARQALREARHEQLERDARALQLARDDALGQLARSSATNDSLAREVAALEGELRRRDGCDPEADAPLKGALRGQRVLYVGGRPSTLNAIRAACERAGAEWLHHDGGMEDRKGLLAEMLPRADRVVFPVDCIDHDSMQQLKRLCAKHGLPFVAVRTASVASFVAAMAGHHAAPGDGAAASRFCLRHG